MPNPPRPRQQIQGEIVTDPVEIAAIEERSRRYKKTAAGQVGCYPVIDAPLPLLARFVAELPAEERQEFLKELLESLPADALTALNEALKSRLDRGA